MPYLELLGDFWGELCAGPELATQWADELLPTLQSVWSAKVPGHGYFKGTCACLSAMLAAGRYDELLALIATEPRPWWQTRRWGVKALLAKGKGAEVRTGKNWPKRPHRADRGGVREHSAGQRLSR